MNSSNFDAGDIVIIDFRFSDLEGSKIRPALVITPAAYNEKSGDAIVLKITSATRTDEWAVPLKPQDLQQGILKKESIIRTDFPLVIEQRLIQQRIGKTKPALLKHVKQKIAELYRL